MLLFEKSSFREAEEWVGEDSRGPRRPLTWVQMHQDQIQHHVCAVAAIAALFFVQYVYTHTGGAAVWNGMAWILRLSLKSSSGVERICLWEWGDWAAIQNMPW